MLGCVRLISQMHSELWRLYGIIINKTTKVPTFFYPISQAIWWIATRSYGVSNMLHWLDDWLTVDNPTSEADANILP